MWVRGLGTGKKAAVSCLGSTATFPRFGDNLLLFLQFTLMGECHLLRSSPHGIKIGGY